MRGLLFACGWLLGGVAASQDGTIVVPDDLMDSIGVVLPERSNAGAAFVSDSFLPIVEVSSSCNVSIVFLWEGAGYQNSLGYFTYVDNPDGSITLTSSELVIGNASFPGAGTASTGDLYDLREADGSLRIFEAGEQIGFFVIADGWRQEPRVQDWDSLALEIPSTEPSENASVGRGCYTTLNELNPEFGVGAVDASRHLALIRFEGIPGFLAGDEFLVAGFEDLDRTRGSDDDFNDLVFVVTANPIEALEETEAFPYAEGDPDADGIEGLMDHYPFDGERAIVTRYPSNGHDVLAFEDNYPGFGDSDFNDAVLAHEFELVTNAAGEITDISGTLHLIARGAGYDHRIGIHLPGIAEGTTGTLQLERWDSSGDVPVQDLGRTVEDLVVNGQRRIEDLFPSTRDALPPIGGNQFTNTLSAAVERNAASVRFWLQFDQPQVAADFGAPPFDLYMGVFHGAEEYDIHRPGFASFEDRPSHLPVESGPEAFLSEQGEPWVFDIPSSWRYPLEQVRVWDSYLDYLPWVASSGEAFQDWYTRPIASPPLVSADLLDYIPTRSWGVDLPKP